MSVIFQVKASNLYHSFITVNSGFRSYKYTSCGQFTQWMHGRLGRGICSHSIMCSGQNKKCLLWAKWNLYSVCNCTKYWFCRSRLDSGPLRCRPQDNFYLHGQNLVCICFLPRSTKKSFYNNYLTFAGGRPFECPFCRSRKLHVFFTWICFS